jgi:uncharacterized metal-binding protein
VKASLSLNLADYGVKRRSHTDYCREEAERVWRAAILPAVAALGAPSPALA